MALKDGSALRGKIVFRIRFSYTIYNEKYFSDDHFSYIVRVLTWRAWRRVERSLKCHGYVSFDLGLTQLR